MVDRNGVGCGIPDGIGTVTLDMVMILVKLYHLFKEYKWIGVG
jgi:hypothetical protein